MNFLCFQVYAQVMFDQFNINSRLSLLLQPKTSLCSVSSYFSCYLTSVFILVLVLVLTITSRQVISKATSPMGLSTLSQFKFCSSQGLSPCSMSSRGRVVTSPQAWMTLLPICLSPSVELLYITLPCQYLLAQYLSHGSYAGRFIFRLYVEVMAFKLFLVGCPIMALYEKQVLTTGKIVVVVVHGHANIF